MKIPSLLALCSALLLGACAGVHVTHTEVATGATNPKAIYIRPFSVQYAKFSGYNNGNGAAIRKSLAPIEFANDLQEELAKLAPARVLAEGESAPLGWLVEGEFEVINSGDPGARWTPAGFAGAGKSCLVLHVRVTDLDHRGVASESKDEVGPSKAGHSRYGRVIYEFDLAGGSGMSGRLGSIYAPGLGDAIPFDFRNAAERIMLALSPDAFRYGYRSSPTRMY